MSQRDLFTTRDDKAKGLPYARAEDDIAVGDYASITKLNSIASGKPPEHSEGIVVKVTARVVSVELEGWHVSFVRATGRERGARTEGFSSYRFIDHVKRQKPRQVAKLKWKKVHDGTYLARGTKSYKWEAQSKHAWELTKTTFQPTMGYAHKSVKVFWWAMKDGERFGTTHPSVAAAKKSVESWVKRFEDAR